MNMKVKDIKNKFYNYQFCGTFFFLTLILIIIKLGVIYRSYRNLSPRKHCFEYLISDIYFLITISFLIMISFHTRWKVIKWINSILIILFLILFYVDIFTIYFFQSHETIFSIANIIRFGGFGFTNIAILWIVILILLFCICFIIASYTQIWNNLSKYFTPKLCLLYCIFGVSIYFIQTVIIRTPVSDTKNILSINIKSLKGEITKKTSVNEIDYKNYIRYETGEGKGLNIILIFYESASAIDSSYLGGNNHMPYLDKIQQDGLSFTNFISNGTTSLQAHLSTLCGILPLRSKYVKGPNGLANFLSSQGYTTTFISTASLQFLNQREFLKSMGFQKIIGEEDFMDKEKYSFDAAPDGDLYDRTLEEIKVQTGKFFIGLQTISFHPPYNSPYCSGDSYCEFQTLEYADEKLYDFYTSLENMGFFESGILVIIGDHRKPSPAEEGESDTFGETRGYRSVATVVGSGIKPGTINNNLIQHTDFYYSIKKLLGSGSISVDMFYNDIFSSVASRNRGIMVPDITFAVFEGGKYKNLDIYGIKNYKYKDAYNYYLAVENYWLQNNKKH